MQTVTKKGAGVAVVISDKIDFKSNKVVKTFHTKG